MSAAIAVKKEAKLTVIASRASSAVDIMPLAAQLNMSAPRSLAEQSPIALGAYPLVPRRGASDSYVDFAGIDH
jgi:hypothetical protein